MVANQVEMFATNLNINKNQRTSDSHRCFVLVKALFDIKISLKYDQTVDIQYNYNAKKRYLNFKTDYFQHKLDLSWCSVYDDSGKLIHNDMYCDT